MIVWSDRSVQIVCSVNTAHAVVLILLLLSCAGKVAFFCTSGIWLTIDTLSARATGSGGP